MLVVEGMLVGMWPQDKWKCLDFGEYVTTSRVIGVVLSLVLLGIVFAISVANPEVTYNYIGTVSV